MEGNEVGVNVVGEKVGFIEGLAVKVDGKALG